MLTLHFKAIVHSAVIIQIVNSNGINTCEKSNEIGKNILG